MTRHRSEDAWTTPVAFMPREVSEGRIWEGGPILPQQLKARDKSHISLNGFEVHALIFSDPDDRWDCVNGWTGPAFQKLQSAPTKPKMDGTHHSGWIGVDFDGTLAEYDGWKGPADLGSPIPSMVARVKAWLEQGIEVRIFTARAYPLGLVESHEVITPYGVLSGHAVRLAHEAGLPSHNVLTAYEACYAIREWCKRHIGRPLAITCIKDFGMFELWDDRAVQVEKNTGRVGFEPKGETTP